MKLIIDIPESAYEAYKEWDKIGVSSVEQTIIASGRPYVEQPTDEWCTDCKEYDHEKNCCPRFNRVIRETLNDAQPTGEWIPVSERLPRRNGVYNVTRIIDETEISDACYFDGQNTWHSDNRVNHGRPYLNDITAWQELPEPYKEGCEEDDDLQE